MPSLRTISDSYFQSLESLTHLDPAGRGLAGYVVGNLYGSPQYLDSGQLQLAATDLAAHGKVICIVTGFGIRTPAGPRAETDGPPGAIYLARVLEQLGCEVVLLTDAFAVPVLEAGSQFAGLKSVTIQVVPLGDEPAWVERFLTSGVGARLTHLIAIERPGPSHTLDSLREQTRSGSVSESEFQAAVPEEHRDVCHNMRGISIDEFTARSHLLFDAIRARRLNIRTIGIIDGGNEIGSGCIPWETLCQAIRRGPASIVACRVNTDHLLIGGTCNWPGYALALAVGHLRGLPSGGAADWPSSREQKLIEYLVAAGAVDGVTADSTPTVDQLEVADYLNVLDQLGGLQVPL